MHLPRGILHGLAAVLAFTSVCAAEEWDNSHTYTEDRVEDDLTFGRDGKVWSSDHRHITGWSIAGEGWTPELHSDRIILTPPHQGAKRGAIWSDHVESHDEWEASFYFRANGPEHGGGLFHMWYAATPQEDIKMASIYTVGKFDGLVLAIGMNNGKGTLRAFLNDRSVSFKDHPAIDQLAFAHCDMDYRNTGHFIKVQVKQTAWTFEVEVNGLHCFQTHRIHLPHGYHFGLTAASAEVPDSFEASSFITHTLKDGNKVPHKKHPDEKNMHGGHDEWAKEVQDHLTHHAEQEHMHDGTFHHYNDAGHSAHSGNDYKDHAAHSGSDYKDADPKGWHWTPEKDEIKHHEAKYYTSEGDRFADLHNRLELMGDQLNILFHDLSLYRDEREKRHNDLYHQIRPLHDYASQTERQLEILSAEIYHVKQLIEEHSPKGHLELLKTDVNNIHNSHWSLAHDLRRMSHPRLGFFVFILMAFQVMLLASYIVYTKRMNAQPKKYL